jgi:hypothetical protein
MAFKMNARSPLMKKLVGDQPNLPEGLREAIEATPNKMMDSPAKMNKGERYDMKMASDQNLTASARKNYAENAEAAQKSAPTKKVIGPEKSVKKVNTDEMGREGHFNPYTAQTKASKRPHAAVDSKYTKKYQNKVIESTDGGRAEKIGYQEDRMHRTHKSNAVMGLRADAYTAEENNFGIKKPQVNITSAAKMKKPKAKPTKGPKKSLVRAKKPFPPTTFK